MDPASRKARDTRILELFEGQHLSPPVIAKRTGIPLATIRKLLRSTYGDRLSEKLREQRRKAEARG